MALLSTLPEDIYHNVCSYLCIPSSLLKELKWVCSKIIKNVGHGGDRYYHLAISYVLNHDKIRKIRWDSRKNKIVSYEKLFVGKNRKIKSATLLMLINYNLL